VTPTTQANVLLRARRRCSICFGLNRDTSLKQGQIAHLDHDPSNSAEENLAFLCFDHHDQYDSTTRQSKNFTLIEVKRFRSELYAAIEMAFSAEVSFGDARAIPDRIPGHYIRCGGFESAELTIRALADGRYHVSGLALWGSGRKYGPNIGELDFVGELNGDTIQYSQTGPDDRRYLASLRLADDNLTVTEENYWTGIFGMNVFFSGDYTKAA
jgi:hypothetical protein